MKWRDSSSSELRTRLLTGVALLALLCLVAVGGLYHNHEPGNEAACPICQVAHMPATAPVAPPVLVGLCPIAPAAPQVKTIRYTPPELARASSRAPPST